MISGVGSSLLESVFIPGPKSDAKELYNITLVEKLLRILYASCQYGEGMYDVAVSARSAGPGSRSGEQ